MVAVTRLYSFDTYWLPRSECRIKGLSILRLALAFFIVSITQDRIQRSLNYLDTQKKKKRKARTHLLIQKGAAIEAICKDTKYLTEAEFYQLMDELLHDPACKFCDVVHEMVRGRAETAEAKEREFAEEEALLKAMQRGELPQGDE